MRVLDPEETCVETRQEEALHPYLERFGITETAIHRIIDAGLSRGGSHCDLYFEHKLSNYIGTEEGAVSRANSHVDLGVGIRVLKDGETGYAFTEEIEPAAMEEAARTAAAIADGPRRKHAAVFERQPAANHYPIRDSWEDVDAAQKASLLGDIEAQVFALDRRILNCRVQFNDEVRYLLMVRSDGRITADLQPMTSIYVNCVAGENGRRENGFCGLCGRYGLEFYTPGVLTQLASEAVRQTVVLFEAGRAPAGEMEVVLAPGSSGILLHETVGHGLEADLTRKNMSRFTGRIGELVAPGFVTIVDDGTLPHLRGTVNVDDEGNPPERTVLVENGRLRSYLHDEISAHHYGVKHTGNGRRESFRFAPMPRMRNTFMLPGPHRREEVISSVKKGIYAEEFTNGQVFLGPGDFTFCVKLGYLIENGKLTAPVRNVNMIGNGPQALSRISMAADDLQISAAGGMCNKNGQAIPVQMGMPTVKVSALTVGGTEV